MINTKTKLRIGRPTDHLEQITNMYTKGLGFSIIGGFDNHGDFSGRMIGHPNHLFHLEFTTHATEKAGKAPSKENLLVFYITSEEDYYKTIENMLKSGFKKVTSFNPYWEGGATTFEDLDGYRVVINNGPSPF